MESWPDFVTEDEEVPQLPVSLPPLRDGWESVIFVVDDQDSFDSSTAALAP